MSEANYLYDAELLLEDGDGALTASAAGQVDSAAKIVDLGAAVRIAGEIVIDISAITINDNNEIYEIALQGSSSATFASVIQELAVVQVGAKEVLSGDIDSATGRITIPFRNDPIGTPYRYLRAYVTIAGTTPSITFTAYLSISKHP